jgi:hypothetical protein
MYTQRTDTKKSVTRDETNIDGDGKSEKKNEQNKK